MSSVRSFSSSRSSSLRQTEEQIFKIADQLINGEPPIMVTDRNRKSVLIALVTLRNEAEAVKDFSRADSASAVLLELSRQQPIPPPKRRHNNNNSSNNSQSRSRCGKSSCCSANERRSFSAKKLDVDDDESLSSPISMKHKDETMSNYSKSVSIYSNEQSVRYISDDDFQEMSKIIDDILKHKKSIDEVLNEHEPENPEDNIRRKLILALRIRREQSKALCNYYEVADLDGIAKALQSKKQEGKTNMMRLKDAEDRIEQFDIRLENLNDQREHEVSALLIQWQQELNDLEDYLEEQEQEMIDSLPSIDDQSFYHMSSRLIEMRDAEKRYVDGFDYEAATIMHRKADELEAEEVEKTRLSIIESQNRKREKWLKEKGKMKETFNTKWELKLKIAKEKYEKFISKIEIAKNQVVREAEEYRRRIRAGLP